MKNFLVISTIFIFFISCNQNEKYTSYQIKSSCAYRVNHSLPVVYINDTIGFLEVNEAGDIYFNSTLNLNEDDRLLYLISEGEKHLFVEMVHRDDYYKGDKIELFCDYKFENRLTNYLKSYLKDSCASQEVDSYRLKDIKKELGL